MTDSNTATAGSTTSNPILSVFTPNLGGYMPSGYSSLPTSDDAQGHHSTTTGGLSREELAAKRLAALGLSVPSSNPDNAPSSTSGNQSK